MDISETSNRDLLTEKYKKVTKCLHLGLSLRKTSKLCGVAVNTVRKVKQSMKQMIQSEGIN